MNNPFALFCQFCLPFAIKKTHFNLILAQIASGETQGIGKGTKGSRFQSAIRTGGGERDTYTPAGPPLDDRAQPPVVCPTEEISRQINGENGQQNKRPGLSALLRRNMQTHLETDPAMDYAASRAVL